MKKISVQCLFFFNLMNCKKRTLNTDLSVLHVSGDIAYPRADFNNSLPPVFLCIHCQQQMPCERGEGRNKIIALPLRNRGSRARSKFTAEHSLTETRDPHRNSPAISNTRVESYNTLAFQAELIPGAALLTMVEEHLKLIWPYRTTTANIPYKPVSSGIHLTAGSSMFVANFKS